MWGGGYLSIYINSNIDLHFANTTSGSTPDDATDSGIRCSKSPNWQWQEASYRKVVSVSPSSMCGSIVKSQFRHLEVTLEVTMSQITSLHM